jgi:hypothetical protein
MTGLKKHSGIIFWAAFIVCMVGLFAINRERIRETISTSGLPNRFAHWFGGKTPEALEVPDEVISPPQTLVVSEPAIVPELIETYTEPPPLEEPAPVATLQRRTLYFIMVDQNGDTHQTPVQRTFPDTDTPLTAALSALLQGTSSDEAQQGLISLIPAGTRIISAAVQQGTAYLSFDENFLYNTLGAEAYADQVKQIVWTATEFPTVKNVQILIEGRKENYLGDNVWIGEPLTRESFSTR